MNRGSVPERSWVVSGMTSAKLAVERVALLAAGIGAQMALGAGLLLDPDEAVDATPHAHPAPVIEIPDRLTPEPVWVWI